MKSESEITSHAQLIDSAIGKHLFVVDGSRLYDIEADAELDDELVTVILENIVRSESRRITNEEVPVPSLFSLSLNVAQTCNMGCGYCYADEGRFGGSRRIMSVDIARASVDRLITESRHGARIMLGFMGGEPFLNRELIHDVVPYAQRAASAAGRSIGFSITTNGTLLEPDDIKLMSDFPFQVTVSIDGSAQLNDFLRPMRNGRSSHAAVQRSLDMFSRYGKPRQLSARATVTPLSGSLRNILEHLLALGFDEAGFSAVVDSPDAALCFKQSDFKSFLERMIECGEFAKERMLLGERSGFSNFEMAMTELHRGTHRPFPCGAGAGYLSVNADGGMFSCHRLIDDPEHAMGSVSAGSDHARRSALLATRHVDKQEPCAQCWARYLCGGGCYHEIDRRGRIACDYIRGWLRYCIATYAEIFEAAPDLLKTFKDSTGYRTAESGHQFYITGGENE